MHDSITNLLEQQGFIQLDGGLATELERHGANLEDELWSARVLIDEPELIRCVHADFLAAGADIIATATYQASIAGFARAGFDSGRAEQLMLLSVDLAQLARESFWSDYRNHAGRMRPLVAASIGPYGASLHDGSEYHGDYGVSRKILRDFHRPRLELLAESDADLLAFETIPSQEEAELLIEMLEDLPGTLAWLSFSCRSGSEVCHGEAFSVCAGLAEQSEQVIAVGINCTPPEYVSALLKSAARVRTPRIVYPNSGEHWNAATQQWGGNKCESFAVDEWYDLGARLLGGCCRTYSEDISEIRSRLASHVSILAPDGGC